MKLLINEMPLQILPNLAKAIGLNEAIFLQQLHYWLNKSAHINGGDRWIYNTASSWSEQFPFWSEKTIRRTIENLREKKLIQTTRQFNKRAYDKTNWFTINYQNVKNLECQIESKPSGQSDHSVTKPSGQSDHIDVDNLSTPIPETTRKKRRQPKKPAASRNNQPLSDHAWFTNWWCFVTEQITGSKYPYKQKDAGQIKQLLKLVGGLENLISRACVYISWPAEKRFPKGSLTIGGLLLQIAEISDIDDDLYDRFVVNSYLPDDSASEQIILKNFQPWKETNVSATAS